jgi:hypothetical protein
MTDDQRIVLNTFGDRTRGSVVDVIREASAKTSSSRARAAYWALVADGYIVLEGSGQVRLRLTR